MRPAEKDMLGNLAVRNVYAARSCFRAGDIVPQSYTFQNSRAHGGSLPFWQNWNHMLTAVFAAAGEKSALFAEKPDCFECLSPYFVWAA